MNLIEIAKRPVFCWVLITIPVRHLNKYKFFRKDNSQELAAEL